MASVPSSSRPRPPASATSPSPLASRRRVALSPLSSFRSSPTPSTSSYQASNYQPSNLSQPSLVSPRFSSFSAAHSTAGSTATVATTQAGGVTRFKRGHVRKKAAPAVLGPKSANPDELDLMALEDPNEVFRLFGVRDVRGLEKRANDAAAAKVAELRTMVGERYRDLLSAADSIVRMRSAAEKLVDRLERVEAGVTVQGVAEGDTPTKRVGATKLVTRSSTTTDESNRTLASPPTLSLTIHLLLSLPSVVHTLLESSSFLQAARLEGVSRVVYQELSGFSYDEEDEDAGLKDAFPIIERQWESIGSLGAVIARRATAELRYWDTTSVTTAQTLASILMLENASFPSSLSTLLEARSKSLSAILDSSTSQKVKASREVGHVLTNLNNILGLILRTVEAASEIFGAAPESTASPADGLLLQILREIESPSAPAGSTEVTPPSLSPVLSTLPNYPLLSRHLPPAILDFCPFLSIDSARNALPPPTAHAQIQEWLAKETERVVEGVTLWIHSLHGGARTLSLIRDSIRSSLACSAGSPSASHAASLQSRLERTIESRLEAVYNQHLSTLISRVAPCLSSLLVALPTSPADLSTAYHLFESPLPFPPPQHYSMPARLAGKTSDPFEGFLGEVVKRVEGRSPLVERGLGELEAHARELRVDLEEWLGGVAQRGEEAGLRERLREQYVLSARDTLDGVYKAMVEVLDGAVGDIDSALFLGNFAFMLSASQSFTRDLLLGDTPAPNSPEGNILAEWQTRLSDLQARSLESWRVQAVERATKKLSESMNAVAVLQPSATLWAWDANRGLTNGSSSSSSPQALPTQPSASILSSLRTLVSAILRLSLHRTQADPSIARSLLAEFEASALPLLRAFVDVVRELEEGKRREEVALQAAWDALFLRKVCEVGLGEEKSGKGVEWDKVVGGLLELVPSSTPLQPTLDLSALSYLQRTQTLFAALLPSSLLSSTTTSAPSANGSINWLPLGAPAIGSSGSEFKSLLGLVKPGPRLGLLPTRG